MAQSVVNAGSAANRSTSISPALGATATSGNLLVAAIARRTGAATPNTPTGYAILRSFTTSGRTVDMFSKVSDGTETDVTITSSNTIQQCAWILELANTGVTLNNSEDVAISTATSVTFSGAATTGNVLAIALGALEDDDFSGDSWSNSFIKQGSFEVAVGGGTDMSAGLATRIITSSGTFGTTLSTSAGAADETWGMLIYLEEAAGTLFFQTNTGSMTPAGDLEKQTNKLLDGSLTPAGDLEKVINFSVDGSLTHAGDLEKEINTSLDGSLTPTGKIVSLVQKVLDGSSAAAGSLATEFIENLFLNSQTNITDTDSTSITIASYAVPAGDNKILRVFVAAEDSVDATVTSLTHNAVDLTFRGRSTVTNSGFSNVVELWDLQLGSTTPSGDIVVTWDANLNALAINAVTIKDLAQQAPEATNSGTLTSATTINTDITTITTDAIIVDGASHASDGTFSITQGPQQILLDEVSVGGTGTTFGVSYEIAGATGSYTEGWSTDASANRFAHLLAAYERASGGTTFFQTNTGSLTASGAVTKSISSLFEGSLSAVGSLIKTATKEFDGSSSPSGDLTTQVVLMRDVSGSSTPSGDLTREINKQLQGSSSPSGTIQKQIIKLLVGSLTPSGNLLKRIEKVLDGSLTPTGTVITAVVILVQLAGQIIVAGALATLFIAGVAVTNMFKNVFRPIFKNIFRRPDK